MLPTIEQAEKLFTFITSFTDELNVKHGLPKGISAKHYKNVAYIASSIAKKSNLDSEKAYILGLLHDYGEYIEDTIKGTFHGTSGYDEMMKKGYDEVAKICLTHSFFDQNINPNDYSYNPSEILRAGNIIKTLNFDDYDKLIQLSDLMGAGDCITNIEDRLNKLAVKYNIRKELMINKIKKANALKEYFDKKCDCNIYNLFSI